MKTSTIGYPRIGPNREMKKALEGYWAGKIETEVLLSISEEIELQSLKDQEEAGISLIGVGDHTLYDHVLDWAFALGCIPDRFNNADLSPLDKYFAMARGIDGAPAMDMSKFMSNNYHYLVPEIDAKTQIKPDFSKYLKQIGSAQNVLGKGRVSPIVLGPVTFTRISKLSGVSDMDVLTKLLPAYSHLLQDLKLLDVPEVQVHEPVLVLDGANDLEDLFSKVYTSFAEVKNIPAINMVTYFEDIPAPVLEWVLRLPSIQSLSLDFTRGNNLQSLRDIKPAFPSHMRLGCGIVDGRSVWADGNSAETRLTEIRAVVGEQVELVVQPSCSLQYLPLDVNAEKGLPQDVRARLAFAKQKLKLVVDAAGKGPDATTLGSGNSAKGTSSSVQSSIAESLPDAMFARCEPFSTRRAKQFAIPGGLATNTIGSFPQTPEMRRARLRHRNGSLSTEDYQNEVDRYIAYSIGVQEAIGMDVFVHGEPERSDMVEYFADKLEGMFITSHGWVQSYGSRYVRPPIVYGDVKRVEAMTVREFSMAQKLTTRPVKGMLTAPATILSWSYVRDDIPSSDQAMQLALAIRDEIRDLEENGCRIVQVDDPGLREGLPLKKARDGAQYLEWATKAFRLSTCGAKAETAIWSHVCYAEVGEVAAALDSMDADVMTVEDARSGGGVVADLVEHGYGKDIGVGVFDIHSAVVPKVAEIQARIEQCVAGGMDPTKLWVNPDCGLKTRKWEEVIPGLKAMTTAAGIVRENMAKGQKEGLASC